MSDSPTLAVGGLAGASHSHFAFHVCDSPMLAVDGEAGATPICLSPFDSLGGEEGWEMLWGQAAVGGSAPAFAAV